jgi:flagellar secretion chaperone FliS
VRGASPLELVVRLYEQIIEDLRQAAKAIAQNAIEERSQRIKHAILVVAHLQSSLDFTQGGKVAQDLNRFYNVLRQNLLHLQFHPSQGGVAQLITDLLAVREAWVKVERAEMISTGPPAMVSSVTPGAEPDSMRVDFEG